MPRMNSADRMSYHATELLSSRVGLPRLASLDAREYRALTYPTAQVSIPALAFALQGWLDSENWRLMGDSSVSTDREVEMSELGSKRERRGERDQSRRQLAASAQLRIEVNES
jgi:hypothetical protein